MTTRVVRRLRRRKESPVLAIGRDRDIVEKGIGSRENVDFVVAKHGGSELLHRVRPDDLVVARAYVLQDTPLREQVRLVRRMAQVDLAIVAGPHRLTVARGSAPHRMERLLAPAVRR